MQLFFILWCTFIIVDQFYMYGIVIYPHNIIDSLPYTFFAALIVAYNVQERR